MKCASSVVLTDHAALGVPGIHSVSTSNGSSNQFLASVVAVSLRVRAGGREDGEIGDGPEDESERLRPAASPPTMPSRLHSAKIAS